VHFAPELIGVLLDVFLIGNDLIELNALDDGVLLLLTDIQFAGILVQVLCDEISVGGQALPLLYAIIEPARGKDSPMEIVGEADLHSVRFDLVSEAFVLVNHQASIFPDFLIEVIIGRTARDVEGCMQMLKIEPYPWGFFQSEEAAGRICVIHEVAHLA